MADSPVDTALAEALRPYVALHDARVSTDRCQCSLCLRARAALVPVPARSPDAPLTVAKATAERVPAEATALCPHDRPTLLCPACSPDGLTEALKRAERAEAQVVLVQEAVRARLAARDWNGARLVIETFASARSAGDGGEQR